MSDARDYVLGQEARAARRLDIQDAHFGDASEQLLSELAIRPGDRIVELGCGPGGLSRRILKRLGADGTLVAIDASQGLLTQAAALLRNAGPAKYEPVLADITSLGSWLDGADVVIGRAVLHHLPMAELFVGRLITRLPAGTRVGFIEPDFRSPLGRIGRLEATGRPEFEALRVWATAINELYLARRISPAVGATLATTMKTAGYNNVRENWSPCRSDAMMIENMSMFYDEVRDYLDSLGILSTAENDRQKSLLAKLPLDGLPPAWGIFRVTCEV